MNIELFMKKISEDADFLKKSITLKLENIEDDKETILKKDDIFDCNQIIFVNNTGKDVKFVINKDKGSFKIVNGEMEYRSFNCTPFNPFHKNFKLWVIDSIASMNIEELLRPRFKIIADSPNSCCKKGDVLIKHKASSLFYSETDKEFMNAYTLSFIEKYPDLFKKLEWWENVFDSEYNEIIPLPNKP